MKRPKSRALRAKEAQRVLDTTPHSPDHELSRRTLSEAFDLADESPKVDLAATAPLLCAGITTYSPMRHWNVQKGQKVGIVGLGGLGHMGLKFAHAFGAHTVLFTTSPNKSPLTCSRKLFSASCCFNSASSWGATAARRSAL